MIPLSRRGPLDAVDSPRSEGHPARNEADEPAIAIGRLETVEGRRTELLQGLRGEPARLSPKFFYDPQGCALYEALCLLPEYYPPKVEAAIFDRHEDAIAAALPREGQLIDLGCGDGAKALRWIERLDVRRYLGVDIAHDSLRQTLRRGSRLFPHVVFEGAVTDFTRGLDLRGQLDDRLSRVFFYPGSSIGNFDSAHAVRLLREVREHLREGDRLLLGVDAPKDVPTLLAAYDDALGITAAFNLNVLRVVNAELGSDFRPQDFLHRAHFDEEASRIEMHLVARHDVTVRLDGALHRVFRAGECIVTEHSYKHTPARMQALLAEAGYGEVRHFSDDEGAYGVYVAAAGGQMQ